MLRCCFLKLILLDADELSTKHKSMNVSKKEHELDASKKCGDNVETHM